MSRRRNAWVHPRNRFPRVSGDEPIMNPLITSADQFSPRERG